MEDLSFYPGAGPPSAAAPKPQRPSCQEKPTPKPNTGTREGDAATEQDNARMHDSKLHTVGPVQCRRESAQIDQATLQISITRAHDRDRDRWPEMRLDGLQCSLFSRW